MILYRELITRIDSAEATGANIVALDLHREHLVLAGSLCVQLRAPGAFINSLYVQPDYQRQGIGRQLMYLAGQVAAAHGKQTMGLACNVANDGARLLYQQLGFLPYGFGKGEGYEELVATLPLQGASEWLLGTAL